MFRCHRVRKNTEGLHCLDFLKFFRPSRPTVIVLLLCCNILSREYQRFFSPPMTLQPNAGHGLPIHEVSTSHTTTHHSRYDFSGRVISSSQRPLPDNTPMPSVGFEPKISAGERLQTYTLDCVASEIGLSGSRFLI